MNMRERLAICGSFPFVNLWAYVRFAIRDVYKRQLERHCEEYSKGIHNYIYFKSTKNKWETVSKSASLLDLSLIHIS